MSTHNICFRWEIRKISAFFGWKKRLICCYALVRYDLWMYLDIFYNACSSFKEVLPRFNSLKQKFTWHMVMQKNRIYRLVRNICSFLSETGNELQLRIRLRLYLNLSLDEKQALYHWPCLTSDMLSMNKPTLVQFFTHTKIVCYNNVKVRVPLA